MHCRNGGQSGPDTFVGIDCTYMSIPNLKVYYVLRSRKHAPFGSADAAKYGLGIDRFGANKYSVVVHKDSLKCVALSCLDNECKCKFECTPTLGVITDIRFFNCDDLKKVGDKVQIPYLVGNNELIKEYDYYSGNDATCVCNSIVRAIIEHELLHCAQYGKEVKDFFEGEEANNILRKVCEAIGKYKCKSDVNVCKSKLEDLKTEFRKFISKYFGEALKEKKDMRENEAFDYMFQIFNELYNECKSSQ
jgi:hypothetical protein